MENGVLVQRLADQLRVGRRPPYDPWASAQEMGLRVNSRSLARGLNAFTDGRELVVVSDAIPRARQRIAVAHEIAHVALRRGITPAVPRSREESFCDWVAMEMLLPRTVFYGRMAWSPRSIWTRFGVDLSVVVFQERAASGQRFYAIGPAGVVCSECGLHASAMRHGCTELTLDDIRRFLQHDGDERYPVGQQLSFEVDSFPTVAAPAGGFDVAAGSGRS